MPLTYFYRDTTSDLSGSPSEIGNFDLLQETGVASSQINTGNMNPTISRSCWFFTPSGDPGTDGTSTGDFTLELRIEIQNADIGMRCYLRRFNSGGTAQGTEIEASEGSQTAGAATRQYNWTDPNLGTWSAGDRLGVRVHFTNNGGVMNQSCRLGANLSSDTLITPFAAGAAPAEGTFAVDDTTTVGWVGERGSAATFAVADDATVEWTGEAPAAGGAGATIVSINHYDTGSSGDITFGFTPDLGDRLVVVWQQRFVSSLVSFPTGWVLVTSGHSATGSVWEKISDGTETGVDVTPSGTIGTSLATVFRIKDHDAATPAEGAWSADAGSATTRALPSLSPSWGAANTLWIGTSHRVFNAGTVSAYPLPDNQALANFAQPAIARCTELANQASGPTGNFVWSSTEATSAALVAIPPAAGATPPPSGTFAVDDDVTVEWSGERQSAGEFAVDDAATVEWTGQRASSGAFDVQDSVTVEWTGEAPPLPGAGGSFAVTDTTTVEWTGQRTSTATFAVDDEVTVGWVGDAPPVGGAAGVFAVTDTVTVEWSAARDSAGTFTVDDTVTVQWHSPIFEPPTFIGIAVGPLREPVLVDIMRDPLAVATIDTADPAAVGELRDTTPTIGELRDDTTPAVGELRDLLEVATMRDPVTIDELRE